MISIKIDGIEYNNRVLLPIKWNALLDERLDECRLSVRGVTVALFNIGAEAIILQTTESGAVQKDFIVWADDSHELPPGSGKYDHELSLIEPTKILEGITCDTLTFSNALGRNFTDDAQTVSPILETKPASSWTYKGDLKTVVLKGESITIAPFLDVFSSDTGSSWSGGERSIVITRPDHVNETISKDDTGTYMYTPTLDGPYVLVYNVIVYIPDTQIYSQITATINFTAAVNYNPLDKYTVASVINRVLDLCEPHLQSEAPRFKLGAAQAITFGSILAPEFSFANMTLKEILDQIGGYIHGIPRLVRGESGKLDTIKYDMLGGTDKAELADDSKYAYIGEAYSINGEQYATVLDSPVDNLVNTLSKGEAAIVEPYFGGYKSVRSEEAYARITDGNMIIETTEPIYSIQKLEVRNPDKTSKRADITGYVFEGSDYGRLSSYDNGYPTSKAFALYYELGQKNVKGLAYKSPNTYNVSRSNYAITNILKSVFGNDYDTSWWTEKNYSKLQFRITYTPVFSSRVMQHKAYVGDNAFERSLYYNQGANLVETRYYGENLKGTIARMGNAEKIRTYRLRDPLLIPTAGQMWDDDYYVSSVAVAIYADCVYLEVGLSKDFNRLSQYIGINSEWRAYEVSEKKAYMRDIAYSDFVVIGADDVVGDGKCLLNIGYGRGSVVESFYYNGGDNQVMTAAVVKGYDDGNSSPITTVTLPVISTVFGNTLNFTFRMADNYSAGTKSDYDSSGDISGYWQTDVPYSDYYGRLATVTFALASTGTSDYAFRVPQGDCVLGYSSKHIAVSDSDRLVVDKNGNEALDFNYNLQFVTTFSNMIIGPGLTRRNSMVGGSASERKGSALYVMQNRIGKFDTTIDFGQATKIVEWVTLPSTAPTRPQLEVDSHGTYTGRVNFGEDPTATVSGNAWAIADMETGEIILARNIPVESGKTFELPTITFTHKLPTRS